MAPEIFVPFFFHWYTGVLPPLDGVAVKVTLVPVQIPPLGLAAIIMVTGTLGYTVFVMMFEVAGDPVAQERLLVMIQFTSSPEASAVVVKVELVAPEIFEPFSCH